MFQITSTQEKASEGNTINQQSALTAASRPKSNELPNVLSVASTRSQCSEPAASAHKLVPEKRENYSQCLDNHNGTCDRRNTCEYSENKNIIVNVKHLEELICALASNSLQQYLNLSTYLYKAMTLTMNATVFNFIFAY